MGTIFNQSPRNYLHVTEEDLQDFVEQCVKISKKTGCDISAVIECAKVLELERKTSAYIHNGDAFDEQVAGFAEIFRDSISSAISAIGTGNAATEMGAIEALGSMVKSGCESIAHAIDMKAVGE